MSKTILTIVIPTHNRLYRLREIIEEILKYPEDMIEILVSDDSTDSSTKDYIMQIQDNRVSYYTREETPFFFERLEKSKGKYIMHLLDKDMVLSRYIGEFIAFLDRNKSVCYGRCRLPFDSRRSKEKYIIYKKGVEGARALGFRRWHPSGFFIEKEKCLGSIKNSLLGKDIIHFDAYMATIGDGAYYQIPMVVTETRREMMKKKSLSITYGKFDELFFSIKKESILFRLYVEELSELPLSKDERKEIMYEIYLRHLDGVTFKYKGILSDKQICRHYGINTIELSNTEMIKNAINFNKNELGYVCRLFDLTLKEKVVLVYKEIQFLISKIV